MDIPRHWACIRAPWTPWDPSHGEPLAKSKRGRAGTEGAWIWRSSPIDQADAQARAVAAVTRWEQWWHGLDGDDGRSRPPFDPDSPFAGLDDRDKMGYPYGVTLREKLLDEPDWPDARGEPRGYVTRNGAGAHVLNVADVMFLDWDTPVFYGLGYAIRRLFKRLFRWPAPPVSFPPSVEPSDAEPIPATLATIKPLRPLAEFLRTHHEWAVRIYKTAGGYRGLVTHATFDPADRTVQDDMAAWACDPMYRQLCRKQRSFRARLTPKGSRLGLWKDGGFPSRFRFRYPTAPPGEKNEADALFARGEAEYESRRAGFRTCAYLGTMGLGGIHPDVMPVLAYHDREAGVDQTDRPLA